VRRLALLLLAGCQLIVNPMPPPEVAGRCGNGVIDPPSAGWSEARVAVSEPVGLARLGARDVAVASRGGEVRVLRNDGGVLAPQPPVTVPGARLAAIAAGRLDAQGDDVVVLDDLEPGVWRILDATGTPQRMASLEGAPSALVLGDFDGDGDLDGVAAGAAGATYLPNDGRGGLRAVAMSTPAAPTALAAGDVDGDGRPDVVAAAHDRSQAFVLYGGAAGTATPFAAGQPVAAGSGPVAVVAAQLDGTLGLDLVVASDGSRDLTVLTDRGDRVHAAGPRVALPAPPAALAAADLDGDGTADLAVALAGGTLAVYFNDGAGGFAHGGDHDLGGEARGLLAADVDGDGRLDLLAAVGDEVLVLGNAVEREDCDDGNTDDGDACPGDCTR
jgi:hypothetical protein